MSATVRSDGSPCIDSDGLPIADVLAEQGMWLCGGGELLGEVASSRRVVGFQQGGVLERLVPGPELAVFLRDAIAADPRMPGGDAGGAIWREDAAERGRGPDGANGCSTSGADSGGPSAQGPSSGLGLLGDDALTGVVRGCRRMGSWAAAMEHAAVAELAGRRIGEARSAGCWVMEAGRYAAAEVAAALSLTRTAAENLVDRALSLDELPATAAALASGRIDVPRALVIVDGLAGLGNELARAVEQQVIAAAPGQTTGQLRAAVSRAAFAADPSAAEKRRAQAERQARVEQQPEPGGVSARLAGRDLPIADTTAAWNRITAIAKALKADGAAGGMDLLRAQVFLGLLLGRPAAAQAPGPGPVAEPAREPDSGPATKPGRVPGTERRPAPTAGQAIRPGPGAGRDS